MAGDVEERGSKKPVRITWDRVFPVPIRKRYELLCGSNYVMDGVKTFCESGRAEIAYNVIEMLLGRQMPILVSHLEFMPTACRVFDAKSLFGYEETGYMIAFVGMSARSMQSEFVCLFFDDINVYARLCTMNEVYKVWEAFSKEIEEMGE